jgi:hypothetical protein
MGLRENIREKRKVKADKKVREEGKLGTKEKIQRRRGK